MEESMLENMLMIKNKDMAQFNGLMVENMRDTYTNFKIIL